MKKGQPLDKAQQEAHSLVKKIRYEGSVLKQVADTLTAYKRFFVSIVRAVYTLIPLVIVLATLIVVAMGAHVALSGRSDPNSVDKISQVVTGVFMTVLSTAFVHKVIMRSTHHENKG